MVKRLSYVIPASLTKNVIIFFVQYRNPAEKGGKMTKRKNLNIWLAMAIFLLALHVGAGLTPALGQCELDKLLTSDGSASDYFGYSVAIWGDTAIVGAYLDNDKGSNSGSAYIFRYNGSSWVEEQKLVASDGEAYDLFGWSVAISGDIAVVGAWQDDDYGSASGKAYIFRFDGSTWVEEEKLWASDSGIEDWFGYSVAISGDTAVIGRNGDDDNGIRSGSAYIFRYNGSSWVEEAKLLAHDGAEEDRFGCSVAIFGDTAVIGAHRDDDNGYKSGSAYVFRYNGSSWVEEPKLLATDGAASDYFGWSVDISGDTAVIGAHGNDDNGSWSGSAYIFRYNGSNWVEEAKLVAYDGAASDFFGWSVAISGDTAVIGAYGDDDNDSDFGSAYIFRYNGSSWVEKKKLLASDGEPGDRFGRSVDISGGTAVIGAYYDDDNDPDSGSAYIFGPSEQTGDFDDDCDVDFRDFAILALAWMTESGDAQWNPDCDISDPKDNVIDWLDLNVFTDNWLTGK